MRSQRNQWKPRKCLENVSFYFTEYSKNTKIHGISFLGDKKCTFFERLCWLLFFALSVYFSVVAIRRTYRKWENSPVIVTFATSETPIWKIPFPAVTICSYFKGDMETAYNNDYDRYGPEMYFSYERYDYLHLICPSSNTPYQNSTFTVNDEMLRFLMLVDPGFGLWSCNWNAENCKYPDHYDYRFFTQMLTKEGVCRTFNMLNRVDFFTDEADLRYYEELEVSLWVSARWSLEDGYANLSPLQVEFPYRTKVSGIQGGLELRFSFEFTGSGFQCTNKFGNKIILHNPEEFPDLNQHYILVGQEQDISIAVKPKMVTTSENLRSYSPEYRKCYFSSERQLRFFKKYNQVNCLTECQANYTYSRCKCVNFYMPRTNSTPICGFASHHCLKSATKEFLQNEIKQSDRCNCLPSCYSLSFDTEVSPMKFSSDHYNHPWDTETISFSRVQIYFKDMQFLTAQRNELYVQTDFLASCGGLLVLFIGFSLISVVELLYFLTLRICCNFYNFGRHPVEK